MWMNRPFPSYLAPLFQNESSSKTLHMKMSLICMKMNMYAELIFISMILHEDSFWQRGQRQLGNDLLILKPQLPKFIGRNSVKKLKQNIQNGKFFSDSRIVFTLCFHVPVPNTHLWMSESLTVILVFLIAFWSVLAGRLRLWINKNSNERVVHSFSQQDILPSIYFLLNIRDHT